jgi:hypothetical protein
MNSRKNLVNRGRKASAHESLTPVGRVGEAGLLAREGSSTASELLAPFPIRLDFKALDVDTPWENFNNSTLELKD